MVLVGSPHLLLGALGVSFTMLAAGVAAWYLGMLDFNFSREPRRTNSSGGSTGSRPSRGGNAPLACCCAPPPNTSWRLL